MAFKSILLVEDSESEQFLYKRRIQAFNPEATIHSAYDGQEALELLDELDEAPDCILLDINMPRMNGFEFLEAYSKKYGTANIVVCMLSSSAHQKDKDRALSFPCVKHYFVKPISTDDLDYLVKLVELRDS